MKLYSFYTENLIHLSTIDERITDGTVSIPILHGKGSLFFQLIDASEGSRSEDQIGLIESIKIVTGSGHRDAHNSSSHKHKSTRGVAATKKKKYEFSEFEIIVQKNRMYLIGFYIDKQLLDESSKRIMIKLTRDCKLSKVVSIYLHEEQSHSFCLRIVNDSGPTRMEAKGKKNKSKREDVPSELARLVDRTPTANTRIQSPQIQERSHATETPMYERSQERVQTRHLEQVQQPLRQPPQLIARALQTKQVSQTQQAPQQHQTHVQYKSKDDSSPISYTSSSSCSGSETTCPRDLHKYKGQSHFSEFELDDYFSNNPYIEAKNDYQTPSRNPFGSGISMNRGSGTDESADGQPAPLPAQQKLAVLRHVRSSDSTLAAPTFARMPADLQDERIQPAQQESGEEYDEQNEQEQDDADADDPKEPEQDDVSEKDDEPETESKLLDRYNTSQTIKSAEYYNDGLLSLYSAVRS